MSLKGKNILITSGGTREYIDDVRVLTNISSGKLGSMIANKCLEEGADVYYLHTKGSVMPKEHPKLFVHEIKTVDDLMKMMPTALSSYGIDAVFMTIAASDFTFRRDKAVKLKSGSPKAFVEYMSKTITTNPKVISYIKHWKPDVYLVGFKFEVNLSHADLVHTAIEAMLKNDGDLVVANDKTEMEKEGSHIGYVITRDGIQTCCDGKDKITEKVVERMKEHFFCT